MALREWLVPNALVNTVCHRLSLQERAVIVVRQ